VVLIEHQSTINPNMPLRMLMYIGRIYEKIIEDRNRYSETKLPLPQPEFIVLYNGEDPYPDVSTLRLSDAFENAAALGLIKGGLPALELIVTVYNINQGRNEAIARNCERLAGYSFFVGKAREFKKSGKSDKEAMKMALSYCIDHDILAEILRAHGSEVINMLLGEWKIDEAKEVWQREAEQRGRKEGEKRGEKRKALETAKNFLGMGLNPEQVAKGTGLDVETVKKLSVQ
jgi:predicted transposase YdaD